jgi:hypothetical protein
MFFGYVDVDTRQCNAEYFDLIAKVLVVDGIGIGLDIKQTARTGYRG